MSLENLIKLGLERNTMLYPKVTRIIDDDHVCPSDGNICLCEKCDTDLLDDGTFECKGCDKLRYGSEESLEALTKLGLEGGFGSGKVGHQKWMRGVTQKQEAPETTSDIPIEKINEAGRPRCKECGRVYPWHNSGCSKLQKRDMSGWTPGESNEGLISDYFRKRNGMSYSYCMKCNASTQHLNGVCRNCPEPNNIRPPIDKKVIRKPPMYDITNIAPSTDPDDATEAEEEEKCALCGSKYPKSHMVTHMELDHGIVVESLESLSKLGLEE